jgi:Protein of unknown function (DUF1194)
MVFLMRQLFFNRRQALALLGLSALGATAQAEVDVALVLAIDCSYSVRADEYRQQMQGLGRAFMNPLVHETIMRGPRGKIAVAAFLWSENKSQHLIMPWKIISTAKEAFSTGNYLLYTARSIQPAGTSISSALEYAKDLLANAPSALRQVIDISTDGINNSGPHIKGIREELAAENVTINALAVVNEVTVLVPYLKEQVMSGEGSFVMQADSYEVYGEAILKKLVKEITGPGVS